MHSSLHERRVQVELNLATALQLRLMRFMLNIKYLM